MSVSIKEVAQQTLEIVKWQGKDYASTLTELLAGAKCPQWKVLAAVSRLMRDGAVEVTPEGRVVAVPKYVEW